MQVIDNFFKDENGEIKYAKICEDCFNTCKQSFRVEVVQCKKRKRKEGKKNV